jgi:hypothetical protein
METPLSAARATRKVSRRTLLGTAGLGAAGLVLGTASPARADTAARTSPSPTSPTSATDGWTSRAKFDALDNGFNGGNGVKTDLNENRAALGWGEAYILQAYLLMWEAYRDPYYLDKMIDHADHVLATRDNVRGVTDWRGLSLPAWRAYWPYSAGELILADAHGRPSLRIRSAWTFAESMDVTVSAGTTPGTFRIQTHHNDYNVGRIHDNLTMDPASADYAVRRIYNTFNGGGDQLTAKDVRPDPAAAGDPAALATTMHSSYVSYPVHTGQIVYPLAWFARIVHTTPKLQEVRKYRDKAHEYFAAADAALAIHDEEYRLTDAGAGYYAYLRGEPVNLDGSDLPHNYSTSMARAYLELTMAGNRPWHRQRATELVRDFVGDLQRKDDGTVSWTYYRSNGLCYSGWPRTADISDNFPVRGPSRVKEDVSHGHVDVTMAMVAYRAGIGIDRADMVRLYRTHTERVMVTAADGRPTVSQFVDGTGQVPMQAYEMMAPTWLGVASFGDTAAAIEAATARMVVNDPAPEIVPIYATAYLNWAARTGARLR